MSSSHQLHDSYWQQEQPIQFDTYERNPPLLQLFNSGERVLDVGCGDGAVAATLISRLTVDVIGTDFSFTALSRAHHQTLPVVLSNIEVALPFKPATFDAVFFGDVIEHIYRPDQALGEIHRVLKPGGRLILSCPNMGYWRYRLRYLVTGLFPETEWIESRLWRSQHIRFFNQTLLYQLLDESGFIPHQFIGISRRRLDRPLLKIFPSYFGMIMLVTATKK